MEVVKDPKCKVCGCTELKSCVGPDQQPCYWAEPNLCSHCRKFTFHTFTPKLKHPNSKEVKHMIKKTYSKVEHELNDAEHDILYNDLIKKWVDNSKKNRDRFLHELISNQRHGK